MRRYAWTVASADLVDLTIRSGTTVLLFLVLAHAAGFRFRRAPAGSARPTAREDFHALLDRTLAGTSLRAVRAARLIDPADAATADDYWFTFRRLTTHEVGCLLVRRADDRVVAVLELVGDRTTVPDAGLPIVRLAPEELGAFELRRRLEPYLDPTRRAPTVERPAA